MKRGSYLKRTPWNPVRKPLSRARKPKKPSKLPKPKIWSLKQSDERFSLWIRERDGKCMRCGKPRSKENPLTCSHFWNRQHKGTRFDPENNDAVCWMPCHKYFWEKEKQGDYRDFKLKQLGPERYAALELRARKPYKEHDAIIDCMKLVGGDKI